jgi:GTP-binding protein EngB required for normal cell division
MKVSIAYNYLHSRKGLNVVLFGETGSGKSSVINMLLNADRASTSDGVIGRTFRSQLYPLEIEGQQFNIFDTAGLGEGEEGRVPTRQAIKNLYDLLQRLKSGISLLIFIFRGRLTEKARSDYKVFYETFCNRKVPIVIVITGMENELDVDAWWDRNSIHFRNYGMRFSGHACITTIKGKRVAGGWSLQQEFERSKADVKKLILEHHINPPWNMHSTHWFTATVSRLLLVEKLNSRRRRELLVRALEQNAGMTRKEAQIEARRFGSLKNDDVEEGCVRILLSFFSR